MTDVCLVTEGRWPLVTGGLSTWTQHFLQSVRGLEVVVVRLGSGPTAGLRWPGFPHVRVLEAGDLEALPRARRYVASGLDAATFVLRHRPDVAERLVYVEHGDLPREIQLAGTTEGGQYFARAARGREARRAGRLRRRVVRQVGLFVGVTRRACRRAEGEGARRALCVPNAVPPVEAAGQRAKGLGYVGRCDPIKGVDRFLRLAAHTDVPSTLCLLGAAPHDGTQLDAPGAVHLNPPDPWRLSPSVVALPSRLEACPFVALEAEARGIVALVSSVADIEESAWIRRLPWDLAAWKASLEACVDEPGSSTGGHVERSTSRWRTFESSWNAIAGEEWGAGENPIRTRLRFRG